MTALLRLARCVLAAIVVLASARVVASPLDLYGGSPASLSQNGAMTAWSEDGSAAFFNPAGLGVGGSKGHTVVQLSYLYAAPELYIQRANNATLKSSPSAPNESGGVVVASILVPLGGKIADKVSLGMVIAVPAGGLLNEESLEPTQPQWLRYQSGMQRITPAFGIGVRPIRQLAIGVGLQMLATFSGADSFNLTVPVPGGGSNTLGNRDVKFALQPTVAATAGITVIPTEHWHLAFAYRQSIGLHIDQPDSVATTVDGDSLGTLAIAAHGDVLYSPNTLSLGATYLPTSNLTVGVDVKYERWSVAPTQAIYVSILFPGLFGDPVPTTQPPAHLFHDTWTPTASAQYSFFHQMFTVRGAYTYRPSYASSPDAAQDYLDVNTHIVGLGGTIHINDPIHLFPRGLNVDLGVQTQIMPRTTAPKNSDNPIGLVAWGGAVVSGGAGLSFEY